MYEASGGTKGTTLADTGLPCIIVTYLASVAAYPSYTDYQAKATRKIPVFLAEPV